MNLELIGASNPMDWIMSIETNFSFKIFIFILFLLLFFFDATLKDTEIQCYREITVSICRKLYKSFRNRR